MRKLKVEYIPSGRLWEVYWVEMGDARSQIKLSRWCASNGIINPRTKKPPTHDGVYKSMWRWAIKKENQDKAYEIMQIGLANTGDFCSKEEFLQLCADHVRSAYQHTTDKKKEIWLKRNGLPDPNPIP